MDGSVHRPRKARRSDALSKDRIVACAIEILDSEGESGLTFRALAVRLATGAGAIYGHVANRDELLSATTGDVIHRAMVGVVVDSEPRAAIKDIALGMFEAIDAHPWVGIQLTREPWQSALLYIFERIGDHVAALGVPGEDQFDYASAILNAILGLASQYAAAARVVPADVDRSALLSAIASRWEGLDANEHPFARRAAAQLPGHDDREQFAVGIDLIVNGMTAGA